MKAIEVDTALLIRDHVLENQAVLGSVNADRADFEAAIRDLSVFEQRWPRALRGSRFRSVILSAAKDLPPGRDPSLRSG